MHSRLGNWPFSILAVSHLIWKMILCLFHFVGEMDLMILIMNMIEYSASNKENIRSGGVILFVSLYLIILIYVYMLSNIALFFKLYERENYRFLKSIQSIFQFISKLLKIWSDSKLNHLWWSTHSCKSNSVAFR